MSEPLSVLLVEDNPGDARLAELALGEAREPGFTVERADTLASALERLSAGGIDLVLLDLTLPDSGGLDTVHAVRAATPDMPVIVLTGGSDRTTGIEAVHAGAQDFLPKGTLEAEVLERAVRYAIERQHLIRELREHGERIIDLYHYAPVGYHSLGPDGAFLEINDTELRWLDYGRDEVVGVKRMPDVLTRESRVRFEEMFPVLQERGEVRDVELDLVRRDGTTFPAIVNATAILDESGAFVRSRSTVTDITERRRAEKELEAFFDVSLDMLCLASVEGYFLRLNPAWETTLGWSLEELTTRPFVEFVHPDDREATVAETARLGTGQKTVSFQNRYRCKDDSYRWLLWSSAGIPDRGLLIASARDITEQRETQARLVTAKEEAERANHAKDAFLSRMSHELRTPLNAVIGFAQLLEIGDLSDEQSGNVRQIRRGGEHLLELINEVLDISRIASGALGSSLEPVDVGVAVREVVALLQPLATDRGVSLRAENLDGMRVLADPQRLTQVLLNLVANAIKYNVEDGSVVVQPQETEGGRVRVSITDTGLGIAPESLPRLFEPFDRLGAEGTSVEGTGLGLALSLALVNAMDGSIEVESELGRGSRFSVELPLAQPQAEHAARASRQRATPGPGAERMVLHVEDNLSSLLLVERIFERRPGVRVMGAMQGGLALDLARQHQPVLILLDLHLPDMEGEEVLRHLRGDPATVSIPVAVLSADATESQIAHLLAAGADDYLTKPIDVRRFLAVVDGLIGAG